MCGKGEDGLNVYFSRLRRFSPTYVGLQCYYLVALHTRIEEMEKRKNLKNLGAKWRAGADWESLSTQATNDLGWVTQLARSPWAGFRGKLNLPSQAGLGSTQYPNPPAGLS